jgi:hypothetical protein
MGGTVDDRWPRRVADHFAVVLAQTRDPGRDQHAAQRRPCPSSACYWLDAPIIEVEGDAADALAAQHSGSSLLDRLGLGWLDLLADDPIPTSRTLTQVVADDLVAERLDPPPVRLPTLAFRSTESLTRWLLMADSYQDLPVSMNQ